MINDQNPSPEPAQKPESPLTGRGSNTGTDLGRRGARARHAVPLADAKAKAEEVRARLLADLSVPEADLPPALALVLGEVAMLQVTLDWLNAQVFEAKAGALPDLLDRRTKTSERLLELLKEIDQHKRARAVSPLEVLARRAREREAANPEPLRPAAGHMEPEPVTTTRDGFLPTPIDRSPTPEPEPKPKLTKPESYWEMKAREQREKEEAEARRKRERLMKTDISKWFR